MLVDLMRGFRLNGWQRIGVILSVIWFVGSAWFTWSAIRQDWKDMYGRQLSECRKLFDDGTLTAPYYEDCKEISESFYARQGLDAFDIAVWIAGDLLIIAIAWLLAWLTISVVRWIRRGFQPST